MHIGSAYHTCPYSVLARHLAEGDLGKLSADSRAGIDQEIPRRGPPESHRQTSTSSGSIHASHFENLKGSDSR